jgi:hypothetical protein
MVTAVPARKFSLTQLAFSATLLLMFNKHTNLFAKIVNCLVKLLVDAIS